MKIRKLITENRWQEAAVIQGEANAVIEALAKVGVFKGVKAALKLQGIDCGECRRPFVPLEEGQVQYLKEVLEKITACDSACIFFCALMQKNYIN